MSISTMPRPHGTLEAGCRGTLLVALALGLLVGCRPAVRRGAANTIEAVAHGVASGRVSTAWKALPADWRSDVTGLVQDIAGRLDRDAYDKFFTILGKTERLLRTKKEFLLKSPRFKELQIDRRALDRNWSATTTILRAITSSDARTVDRLARIDVGRFMSRTGDPVFREMIRLADTVDGELPSRLVALRNLAADTVSQDGDTATVAVTLDGDTHQVEMVRVGGRWVTEVMAGEWDEMIVRARQAVAALDLTGNRLPIMQALGMVEATLDVLLAARTQEQFDAALRQLASLDSLTPPW